MVIWCTLLLLLLTGCLLKSTVVLLKHRETCINYPIFPEGKNDFAFCSSQFGVHRFFIIGDQETRGPFILEKVLSGCVSMNVFIWPKGHALKGQIIMLWSSPPVCFVCMGEPCVRDRGSNGILEKRWSFIPVNRSSVELVVCKCNTTDLGTELQHTGTLMQTFSKISLKKNICYCFYEVIIKKYLPTQRD